MLNYNQLRKMSSYKRLQFILNYIKPQFNNNSETYISPNVNFSNLIHYGKTDVPNSVSKQDFDTLLEEPLAQTSLNFFLLMKWINHYNIDYKLNMGKYQNSKEISFTIFDIAKDTAVQLGSYLMQFSIIYNKEYIDLSDSPKTIMTFNYDKPLKPEYFDRNIAGTWPTEKNKKPHRLMEKRPNPFRDLGDDDEEISY